jgi:hypothetical protein
LNDRSHRGLRLDDPTAHGTSSQNYLDLPAGNPETLNGPPFYFKSEIEVLLKLSSRHLLTALLLCASLFLLSEPAHADSLHGCVASAPNSIILLNEADHQTYDLLGDIAAFKIGERIKISGKKKKDTSGKRYFLVGKLSKNYGACKVSPSAR